MPDGSERPIAYASITLSKGERNYSQLEKEGLACIFGVKSFISTFWVIHLTRSPTTGPFWLLLSECKASSPQSSAQVRRWSLFLASYEYTLKFRGTQLHKNADALSRLPVAVKMPAKEEPPEPVLLLEQLYYAPITSQQIVTWTRQDPNLLPLLQVLQQGWPARSTPELAPFYSRKDEFSLLNGCILWGSRVVVPERGRQLC